MKICAKVINSSFWVVEFLIAIKSHFALIFNFTDPICFKPIATHRSQHHG